MLSFVFAALALVLLALGLLLWPLLRRPQTPSAKSEADNLAVFRDQKAELEAEFAAGQLGQADRDAALDELAERLARELPEQHSAPTPAPPRRRPGLALGLALGLPLVAAALYLKLGTPAAFGPQAQAPRVPSQEEMVAMVDRLAAKMSENPGDLTGWLLLARSHGALGRYAEAAAAYARADALSPKDPEILANWANAEAMRAQGELEGKPYELALQALAVEPAFLPALAMAAAHELRSGRLALARTHLAAILAQLPEDAAERPRVQALLAEIDAAPAKAGKR